MKLIILLLTNWKSFQTWRPVLTLTLIMIMWHCDTFNIKYRLTFWLWPSLDEVSRPDGLKEWCQSQGEDSPACWGDRLLAGVGDVLLLVLPGVVQHQGAPGRIGDDSWNYSSLKLLKRKVCVVLNIRTLVVKTGCCAEMTPYKNQYLDIKCTGLNILLVKS